MSFFNRTPSVSVSEAAQKARVQGSALVDVRMPDEYSSGHASGAINCPLPSLSSCFEKLKQLDTVYVICHSGGRSAAAVSQMLPHGINAINVSGGTLAWNAHGLPLD